MNTTANAGPRPQFSLDGRMGHHRHVELPVLERSRLFAGLTGCGRSFCSIGFVSFMMSYAASQLHASQLAMSNSRSSDSSNTGSLDAALCINGQEIATVRAPTVTSNRFISLTCSEPRVRQRAAMVNGERLLSNALQRKNWHFVGTGQTNSAKFPSSNRRLVHLSKLAVQQQKQPARLRWRKLPT